MDVRDCYLSLERSLHEHATMRAVACDPAVQLVRLEYGPNRPEVFNEFRVLVVLDERARLTREALERLLPATVQLALPDGRVAELRVDPIAADEYKRRSTLPPGTRGETPIGDFPILPL